MTSAIQYQDASSLPTHVLKTSYGDASHSTSSVAPKILRLEIKAIESVAASKHTKFAEFAARLERNPERAQGLARARELLSEALYGDEPITLKALRMKAGLTQTQLAARLDTSQPQIAKIESGRQEPGIATCRKLCAVLDISLDDLSAALLNQDMINERKVSK